MNSGHYVPDAEFAPAPLGARGRITTSIVAATVLIALAVVTVLMLTQRPPPPWPVFLAIGVTLPVQAVIWYGTRVRRYRLREDELMVERAFRTVRLPLAGLKDAAPDRDAMRGAWKIRGNKGLGTISGRFRSKRLGRFDAYLSDAEHAVVLRWPDRCVVISPEQHFFFIETVRKRAGLSR
jgi:hypothetical protein